MNANAFWGEGCDVTRKEKERARQIQEINVTLNNLFSFILKTVSVIFIVSPWYKMCIDLIT